MFRVSVGTTGSSPLTRGKLREVAQLHERRGLIPAHAGKTAKRQRTSSAHTAHPRSRGENLVIKAKNAQRVGSSPLTRGKRNRRRHGQGGHGLIPAHAGKTASPASSWTARRAHPRSRGENAINSLGAGIAEGSSPLTRGKPACRSRQSRPRRLIPAHAGKTMDDRPCRRGRPAHPRSRGENQEFNEALLSLGGSSPLTRGKRHLMTATIKGRGLIPAHAGKTRSAGQQTGSGRAHPRSRGENSITRMFAALVRGSSPLTRGKLT